jgi:hypothetical protein
VAGYRHITYANIVYFGVDTKTARPGGARRFITTVMFREKLTAAFGLDAGLNLREYAAQGRPQGYQCADDSDGNQGGNQAVFDCGRAFIGFQETYKSTHRSLLTKILGQRPLIRIRKTTAERLKIGEGSRLFTSESNMIVCK